MREHLTRLSLRLTLTTLFVVVLLAAATALLVSHGYRQAQHAVAQGADTGAIVLSTLLAVALCCVLALALMLLVTRRFLTRPIAELVAGTRALADGNLEVRLPVARSDELGELAASFNEMAAELAQSRHLLEHRVRERTHELSTLLEVSRTVASTLELEPLLELVLDQLQVIVSGSSAIIMILEGEELAVLKYRGPAPQELVVAVRLPLDGSAPYEDVIRQRKPVIVADARGDTPLSRAFAHETGRLRTDIFGYARSWMGVPLLLKERAIGMMAIVHRKPNFYTYHHAQLAGAIAAQAAVAIENARLYAQAHDVAVLEERARLARDLHDSVTQALFSITLHVRAVQLAQERVGIDPESALGRGMRQLTDLTQGALAEMRALIFELRPNALAEEGLSAALRKQAAALEAREELVVRVQAPPERLALAAEVEENLYRLAVEALNNVLKHAAATQAMVRLEPAEDGTLILEVRDDGAGFDPAIERPGHLGLGTMAERARRIGGRLEITSAPGQGTTVCVEVPGACRPVARPV